MLPRHRRRYGTYGEERRTKPRTTLRVIIGIVFVLVVWQLVRLIGAALGGGADRAASALLTVRSGGVQVSLQGEAWQAGESGLRMSVNDAVSSRSDGDAILQFFDGTRLRLNGGASLRIDESERSDDTSTLSVSLQDGAIWMATPSSAVFTGSILRHITFNGTSFTVPAGAQLLASKDLLIVLRAEGPGIVANFPASSQSVIIGEGQRLVIDPTHMKTEKDIYALRDPLTQADLNEPFLTSSFALLSTLVDRKEPADEIPTSTSNSSSSSDESTATIDAADLIILAPEDGAIITTPTVSVRGSVGERIVSLTVNGQTVNIAPNRTFSAEARMSTDETEASISIEARDAQGILVARTVRKIQNRFRPIVQPVKIKSPVGSGETLTTSATDVEITGEAPEGTQAIMVNDYQLQLFKPGDRTWSYLASMNNGNLKPGINNYTVVAVGSDGHTSPGRTLTIVYQQDASGSGSGTQAPLKQNIPLEPGTLTVTSPSAGTEGRTDRLELSILGSCSPATASISVNGYTLSLYQPGSTEWKYIASTSLATMKRGKNLYRIVSRNARGEILDLLEYTLTLAP